MRIHKNHDDTSDICSTIYTVQHCLAHPNPLPQTLYEKNKTMDSMDTLADTRVAFSFLCSAGLGDPLVQSLSVALPLSLLPRCTSFLCNAGMDRGNEAGVVLLQSGQNMAEPLPYRLGPLKSKHTVTSTVGCANKSQCLAGSTTGT